MANPLGSEPKRSRYRLLGLVGQGQFGRVFCAVHRQTGRLVALKDLNRDRFPTAQFLRELRFLLSLQHPNIVTFQAVEHTATGRYLITDYCEGGTLRSLMAEEGRLSLSQSLKLILDVLAGLEHAHAQQIVHCDIKPENILLSVTAAGWTARISDFGIARLTQELNDPRFNNTGSPAYMAPERFYGQHSPTSDLYSVGVLLYELLVGHRPFSGTPGELMTAHLNQQVQFPETIPEGWQPILSTALQKLSARRFQSAQEMRAAILAIACQSQLLDPDPLTLGPDFLLQPATLPGPTLFLAQHQERLHFPQTSLCTAIAASQTYLLRAGGQQATCQSWRSLKAAPTTYAPAPELWPLAPLPSPIVQLLCRPQGCFVVAEKSLHLIRPAEHRVSRMPELIHDMPPLCQVAIEPQGRWFATLKADPTSEHSLLRFRHLPQAKVSLWIAPQPLRLALPAASQAARLLALDAHHVAILTESSCTAHTAAQSKYSMSGTGVQICCRRGQLIGFLMLPLYLENPQITNAPYRLIAIDRDHSGVVVLIDLKPYRIFRIGVGMTPDFLAIAPWGYLLANRAGKIIMLDTEGRKVGELYAPAPITAVAALEMHQLAIATWSGSQGNIYTINLKEVDVDLIF